MNKQIIIVGFVAFALSLSALLATTAYGMEASIRFEESSDSEEYGTAEDLEREEIFSVREEVKKAQKLLSDGGNINRINEFGYTPLDYAVRGADTALTQQLIAAGANVNAKDHWGGTILHSATRVSTFVDYQAEPHKTCMINIVKLLLATINNPLEKDNNGDTPLKCLETQDRGNASPISQLIRGEVKFRKAFLARLFEGGLAHPIKGQEDIGLPLEVQEMILEKAFPEEAAQRLAAREAPEVAERFKALPFSEE